jgi:hypothetical protein
MDGWMAKNGIAVAVTVERDFQQEGQRASGDHFREE